ncbi:unnamed protein product [Orchesella dallaii]|uniref:Odorant receptor n=1 Tax=Orchesella dallaii TaxID=48710 RepID=A0ABP1PT65_9HEXA
MSKRMKITKVLRRLFEAASIQHQAGNYASLCKLPKITPFEWDPVRELLTVIKPWWNLKKALVLSIHIGIGISSLFEIIFSTAIQPAINKHELLLRILLSNIICWSFVYHYHIWSDSEGFCALLNCIIRFNKLETGNLDTKVMRRILVAFKQGMMLTGIAIGLLIVACPQTPPYPTSLLQYIPTPWGWYTFIAFVVLKMIEVWNLVSWICYTALVCFCAVLCNSAMYVGCKSLKKFSFKESIKKHSILSLLATYINVQFRNSLHFSILIAVILLGILSSTAAIKYHDAMPSTMMYVVAVVSADSTATSLFIAMIPGKVNGISKDVIHAWRRQYSCGINKLERKVIRSLREIKIQFGTANFFEKDTCLVVVNFQILRTVDVLLLMS